jgi:hypothetical protein
MLRRVALVRTDVSEESIPPIFRVTGIGELGTTLAVTINWSTLRRNTMWVAALKFDSSTASVFSRQSSWLLIQRPRVRFPALPDLMSSIGSGTRSTQLRGDKWEATWKRLRSRKLRLTAVVDPPRWPREAPPSAKISTKFRRQVSVAQSV